MGSDSGINCLFSRQITHCATDYYPFGMVARSYNPTSYLYGFNGQEKVDELGEGHTTALFWEYDGRLGKRWNVDPVKDESESPFATNKNNPVKYDDPNGDCATCSTEVGGNVGFSFAFGGTAKQNSFTVTGSLGVSYGGDNAQGGLNLSVNLYKGGIGTANATVGDKKLYADFILSPSFTHGSGKGESMPVNTFNAMSSTGVSSTISNSFTFAENFILSTAGRNQMTASWGGRLGNTSFQTYNDMGLMGGDGGDRWWSAGVGFIAKGGKGVFFVGGWDGFTGENIRDRNDASGFKTWSKNGQDYFKMSPGGSNLNNGFTFLRLNSEKGIGFQVSASGKGIHDAMYTQNFIHKLWGIPRFNTYAPESIKVTLLTNWEK